MSPAPEPIHAHAIDNIRFIRDAMARASEFTAIPGWGGVAMGVTAIIAAIISGPPDGTPRWVLIWFAEAAVAPPPAVAERGPAAGCTDPSHTAPA